MLEAELSFALELADRADALSMEYFRTDLHVREKPDSSPVTEADVRVERLLRGAIEDRFPTDAVLGEEDGLDGEGSRRWILDPIDGTKNYADGVQVWATLICLEIDGEPLLGVVSAPALGERYQAVRGEGAMLNNRQIHPSRADRIDRAFVVFNDAADWVDGEYAAGFGDIVRTARRARGFGDFWGHMLVARGSADVMLQPSLATWDWAALQVVVKEAGGRMSTLEGDVLRHGGSVLTSNGRLHDEVIVRLAHGRRESRVPGRDPLTTSEPDRGAD
ncbi:MAG: inositol monophosphatase family protein [Actinomycetota bacterium]